MFIQSGNEVKSFESSQQINAEDKTLHLLCVGSECLIMKWCIVYTGSSGVQGQLSVQLFPLSKIKQQRTENN